MQKNDLYTMFADTRSVSDRIASLNTDSSLRISVVPWIVGRVYWDYVDSVINLTKAFKLSELKSCNRLLRELSESFDFRRCKYINQTLRALEEAKAEELQGRYYADFSEPYKQLREHISEFYPDLSADTADYLASVYMTLAIGAALSRYCNAIDREIAMELSLKSEHSIYPPEINRANKLLREYLGNRDKSLRKGDLGTVADRIYDVIVNLPLTAFPETEFYKQQTTSFDIRLL